VVRRPSTNRRNIDTYLLVTSALFADNYNKPDKRSDCPASAQGINFMPKTTDDGQQTIAKHIRAFFQNARPHASNCRWPLATNAIGAEETLAVLDVLLSGRITMGRRVADFEEAWSNFLGVKHSVMVNSGSSANLLAMSALASPTRKTGLRPGDEVIVPAVTWPTTVFPIVQVGCVPVFVDVDAETLNMTPDAVRRAITPKTRAVMPVHLLGNPCDMPGIMRLADERDLHVIEDCCEAHGARVGDQPVGTFGDMSTFSFYFSHHMTTIEGGMIAVRDHEEWANLLFSARSHGWLRQRSDRDQLAKLFDQRDDRWLFVTPGYNLRPMELNAAIGLVQLRQMPDFIRRRAELRRTLLEGLADCEDVLRFQRALPDHFHSAFGFSMVIREDAPFTRDAFCDHLEASGVETRPLVGGNLARQPAFEHIPWRAYSTLHVADDIDCNGLMIGINPGVTTEQTEYVIECIRAFVKQTGHTGSRGLRPVRACG
jgi:CDP-6-deoxy-D-xylo-4-hexulose-3-dehydrase